MPRALVLSPFATVPADAGQRRRVAQITTLLRDRGFDITFLLYAFEDGWKTQINESWLAELRASWGEVIAWRAFSKVGVAPETGSTHVLDEWWDPQLETLLTQIFANRFFDVFVVNNVWLSKAFDFAPRSTIKVLDTHDIFSQRSRSYERLRIKPEFYFPSESKELDGVNRSDIVLGIQDDDAEWLLERAKAASLCVPYCPVTALGDEEPDRTDYLREDKVTFGFLGSGHAFNIAGLRAFLPELKDLVGRTAAPVEFLIGGTVCESIEGEGPWINCGYISDEQAFYAKLDAVVAPVFEGSGFKVKVADAAARGIPLLAAEHAAIGLSLDPSMLARSPRELAERVVDIALRRPSYSDLQAASRTAYLDLQYRTERGARSLVRAIDGLQRVVVFDLSNLDPLAAVAVMFGWSGSFHLLRPFARQVVVAPGELRHVFADTCVPGLTFASLEEAKALGSKVIQWVCVDEGRRHASSGAEVMSDSRWAAALGYANPSDGAGALAGIDASFWRNANWGEMQKKAARWMLANTKWPQKSDRTTTIIATDARRAASLRVPFNRLFGEKFVSVDLRDREQFLALFAQLVSGNAARLVIADGSNPERAQILRDLCNVRGILCSGAVGEGVCTPAPVEAPDPNRVYEQFERFWFRAIDRLQIGPGRNPLSKRAASPREHNQI